MTLIFILVAAMAVGTVLQIMLEKMQHYKFLAGAYRRWAQELQKSNDELRRQLSAYETERRSGNDTGGETKDNGGDRKEPPETVFTAQAGS